MDYYEDPAMYDLSFRGRKEDIAFYLAAAERAQGPVLEYGAGSGRVTLPLLKAGYEVTAVDLSDSMLSKLTERCARLSQKQRARLRVVQADMCKQRKLGRFPLVLATFNVVGHLLELKQMQAFLERVKEHLSPGGVFIFDVPLPSAEELECDPKEGYVCPPFRHPVSGKKIRQTEYFHYDALRQVLTVDSLLEIEGEKKKRLMPLILRQWFPQELRLLLSSAGFEQLEFLADYREEPALEQVNMLVVRASLKRRPA